MEWFVWSGLYGVVDVRVVTSQYSLNHRGGDLFGSGAGQ
jgi:hypothetical protein